MVCRLCPLVKNCFDKGTCDTSVLGKAFEGLHKKNKKLRMENLALKKEIEKLKEEIDDLSIPGF